ncbi:MAG: type II secretion system major pseudopilin GspG [Planctomycetota bacterium]
MQRIRKHSARELGFTLVEIMVVVIVLAILASVIVPQFGNTAYNSKVSTAKGHIAVLENALERFNMNMDRYPTSSEGLKVLVERPAEGASSWDGPYIKALKSDPWGNEYAYRSPGLNGSKTFDLWSRGADNKDGGEDKAKDVTNWENPKEPK